MVFLPHTNNVILLEPYCGTITEPGLPVKIPRRLKQWKRRLKVYSRPFILYRDYSNSLTLSNAGEPFLRLKPCSDPSRQGNVKKITFIIKGRFMGILRAFLCFISLMESSFPSTVFCVFGCIFHEGVVLDTEIWGSWWKNTQKFPKDDQERIKCVYISCDSVWNIH